MWRREIQFSNGTNAFRPADMVALLCMPCQFPDTNGMSERFLVAERGTRCVQLMTAFPGRNGRCVAKIQHHLFNSLSSVLTIQRMYPTDSLLTFSFPMGRLLGVPLRLSFLLPVVVIALMWRLQDPMFGAISGAIVLLSLLLHEIAHLLVARQYGERPGTVVIWPLGGMQSSHPPHEFRINLAVACAGPLMNLLIACVAGWKLHQTGQISVLFNPFGLLDLKGPSDLGIGNSCLRVVFVTNWCLAVLNLIPVRPLDAGHVVAGFLNLRFLEQETRDLMLRVGLVFSLFGLLAGFVFDVSSVVALSAFILVLHIHDISRWTPTFEPDESFLGYDFSEGYTSLDKPDQEQDIAEEDASVGILDRWKIRRDEEKVRREAEDRLQEEQQLDVILDKLHTQGRESLSSREVNLLNRVSARLRQRNVQDL